MKELLEELEQARQALAALAQRGAKPSRYDARRVLLALGEILLEGQVAGTEATVQKLKATLSELAEGWTDACREELAVAAAEHVQGTDPRWLDHPRFDFVYLVDARRRLEMRLLALEHLGEEQDEGWLDRIGQADLRLEPYLKRAEGRL